MELVYSEGEELFREEMRAVLAPWRPVEQLLQRSAPDTELLEMLRQEVFDCQARWRTQESLASLHSITAYEVGYRLVPLASLGRAILDCLPQEGRPAQSGGSCNLAILPGIGAEGSASGEGVLPARVHLLGRLDAAAGTVVLGGEQAWFVAPGGIGVSASVASLDMVEGLYEAVVAEPAWVVRLADDLAGGLLHSAAIYIAFEQLGGAQCCLDGAIAYVTQRRSLGQPIGAFQSVKHQLADIYVEIELARSNAYRALAMLEESIAAQEPADAMGAILARVSACDAYTAASKAFTHLQGAYGTIWENEAHLHLRRARFLRDFLGGPDLWLDRIDFGAPGWFAQYHETENA